MSVSDNDLENSAGTADSGLPGGQDMPDTIVMDEAIDPNYVPGEDEVLEYVKWLGMDLEKDQDLFWIAREGLMAPLPQDWKPCRQKDTDEIYYFNFLTGESTWDHPCDGYYKRLYEEEKKKKEIQIKQSGDQKRTKAKQDVDLLLGKAEMKKKKSKSVDVLQLGAVGEKGGGGSAAAGTGLGSLERKPLPGIIGKLPLPNPLSNTPLGIAEKPLAATTTTTTTKPPLPVTQQPQSVSTSAPANIGVEMVGDIVSTNDITSNNGKSKSSSKLVAATAAAAVSKTEQSSGNNSSTRKATVDSPVPMRNIESKLDAAAAIPAVDLNGRGGEVGGGSGTLFGYQKSALGSIKADNKSVSSNNNNDLHRHDSKTTSAAADCKATSTGADSKDVRLQVDNSSCSKAEQRNNNDLVSVAASAAPKISPLADAFRAEPLVASSSSFSSELQQLPRSIAPVGTAARLSSGFAPPVATPAAPLSAVVSSGAAAAVSKVMIDPSSTLSVDITSSGSSPLPPTRSSSPSSIFNKLRSISQCRNEVGGDEDVVAAGGGERGVALDIPSPLSPPSIVALAVHRANNGAMEAMIASLEVELARTRQKAVEAEARHDSMEQSFLKKEGELRLRISSLETEVDTLEQERRQLKKRIMGLEDQTSVATVGRTVSTTAPAISVGDSVTAATASAALAVRQVAHDSEVARLEIKLKTLQDGLNSEVAAHLRSKAKLLSIEESAPQSAALAAAEESSLLSKEEAYKTERIQQQKEMERGKILVAELQAAVRKHTVTIEDLHVKIDISTSSNQTLERQLALRQSDIVERDAMIQQFLANETSMKSKQSSLESELYSTKCCVLTLQQQSLDDSTAAASAAAQSVSDGSALAAVAASSVTAPLLQANRALQEEATKLRGEVASISAEKNLLHIQSYRHEAELKHARTELNRVASVEENARGLATQNRVLDSQLAAARADSANALAAAAFDKTADESKISSLTTQLTRQTDEVQRLRKLSVQQREDEHSADSQQQASIVALEAELSSAHAALEAEKVLASQKEKKLRGYQEELLQLQKRATSAASPLRGLSSSSSSSPSTNYSEAEVSAKIADALSRAQQVHDKKINELSIRLFSNHSSSSSDKDKKLEEQSARAKDELINNLNVNLSQVQASLLASQLQHQQVAEQLAAATAAAADAQAASLEATNASANEARSLVPSAAQIDQSSSRSMAEEAAAAATANKAQQQLLQTTQENLRACQMRLNQETAKSQETDRVIHELEIKHSKLVGEHIALTHKVNALNSSLEVEVSRASSLERGSEQYKQRWLAAEAVAGEATRELELRVAEDAVSALRAAAVAAAQLSKSQSSTQASVGAKAINEEQMAEVAAANEAANIALDSALNKIENLTKQLELADAQIITLRQQLSVALSANATAATKHAAISTTAATTTTSSSSSSVPNLVLSGALNHQSFPQQQHFSTTGAAVGGDGGGGGGAVGSIVELSMMVGRQQSMICRLEDQLRDQRGGGGGLPYQQAYIQQQQQQHMAPPPLLPLAPPFTPAFRQQQHPNSSTFYPPSSAEMMTPEPASLLIEQHHQPQHVRVKFAADADTHASEKVAAATTHYGTSSTDDNEEEAVFMPFQSHRQNHKPLGKSAARKDFIAAQMAVLLNKHGLLLADGSSGDGGIPVIPLAFLGGGSSASSSHAAAAAVAAPSAAAVAADCTLISYGEMRAKNEAQFSKEASRLLVAIKKAVRGEQHVIAQMKISWKSKEQPVSAGGGVTTAVINDATLIINEAIEQLRLAQEFCRQREPKVNRLQKQLSILSQHSVTTLVAAAARQRRTSDDPPTAAASSAPSHAAAADAAKDVLRAVHRILSELASEARTFSLTIAATAASKMHSTSHAAAQQKLQQPHQRESQHQHNKENNAGVFDGRSSYPEDNRYFDKDEANQSPLVLDEYVYVAPDWYSGGGTGNGNGELFSRRTSSQHGKQQQQPLRSSYPLQQLPSSAAVPAAGGGRSYFPQTGDGVHQKDLLRRQIEKISSRQTQSQDAYDSHARWLEQLTREVGAFCHTTNSSSTAASTATSSYPDIAAGPNQQRLFGGLDLGPAAVVVAGARVSSSTTSAAGTKGSSSSSYTAAADEIAKRQQHHQLSQSLEAMLLRASST